MRDASQEDGIDVNEAVGPDILLRPQTLTPHSAEPADAYSTFCRAGRADAARWEAQVDWRSHFPFRELSCRRPSPWR